MSKLNQSYKDLIEPANFKRNFKNEAEFIDWLNTDGTTLEDLEATLKEFEKAEEYRICIIIKNQIKNGNTKEQSWSKETSAKESN